MSEEGGDVRFETANGPVHSGSGNIFIGADVYRERRTTAEPWQVALDQRLNLAECFVPPPGYGAVVERLGSAGATVLLAGSPGDGRRTAGLMALHRVGGDDRLFRESSLPGDRERLPDPEPGERLLLNLSGLAEAEYARAAGFLLRWRGKIAEAGARMVAVLPSTDEALVDSALHPLLLEIGRPREQAVLRRHLVSAAVPFDLDDLRAETPPGRLGGLAMRDMRRLTVLVGQARSADRHGRGIRGWLQDTLSALSDRSDDVAVQVAALDSGAQRALLLSAAMLEGAPADAVFHHTDRLLAMVEHTPDGRPPLERADLAERLGKLPLKVVDGRIRFTALAYDGAVRAHFWTYFPGLREQFGTWVAGTVEKPVAMPNVDDRTRLVGRFTEQSLRTGEWALLQRLAGTWADDPRHGEEAYVVIRLGLEDERYGAGFRGWLYDQSTKGGLQPSAVRVLARVCAEVLARTHPDQALVRLHHLARGTVGSGVTEARDTLFALVRRDRRLYRKLLARVADQLEAGRDGGPDAELFLRLITPVEFGTEPDVEARCLRGVVGSDLSSRSRAGVEQWLAAAVVAPPGEDERLLDTLVGVAEGRAELLGRLYLGAYAWTAAVQPAEVRIQRAEMASRLWQKIDIAQGIEPVGSVRARRSGERTR
ncbi:hypothetical protein ACFWOG_08180 [Kitasatospora sp. NPDC058406]|uniref:hypothetical protein n=1 Tax=Kitasatospora sp. NPDC058406 TaxID=3346483 RepID=UPI003658A356